MISESLDQWGLPVEEIKIKKQPVKNIRLLKEKKDLYEAENFLSLFENRIDSILMEAHVSVDIGDVDRGSVTYTVKTSVDMQPYIEAARKKAENEYDDISKHDEAINDYLDDMLSSRVIERKLEDGIWDVIRHSGQFDGIKVDANIPSAYRLKDIEEMSFEIKISASPKHVDSEDIEKKVIEIISGLEI